MGYAASCVLWLDSLVRQAEGCLQQWAGLWICFPAWAHWEKLLQSHKSSLWSWLMGDVCHKFLGWTGPLDSLWGWSALSTCLSVWVLLGFTASRCPHQPFLSYGDGSHVLQLVDLWLSFSAWVWADQAPGLAKLFHGGLESNRPVSLARLGHWLGSTDGQSCWLGQLLKHRGMLPSLPCSGILSCVLSMNRCKLFLVWGEVKSGVTYVTIWVTSLIDNSRSGDSLWFSLAFPND